ncbi:subtilase-type protease inhibitor [Streptomyces sp. AJS327]|uniref:subtilase-type protease inhibitor n=1 Tax=Streptomyces sp. AJS327 TaxID=2545265 RepID=UPI0035B55467
MRHLTRLTLLGSLLTLTALAPLSGAETATAVDREGPAAHSLYPPSALALTVAPGTSARTATPDRAVTLSCAPRPSGTHPAPERACAEIAAAQGDLDGLPGQRDRFCTREYRPVVVTVQGVWRGERVDYERAFDNSCLKDAHGGGVLAF